MPECVRQGWCRCPQPIQPDTAFCEVCEGRHESGIYKSGSLDARRKAIWWCQSCHTRYALLTWAEQQRFPALDVAPFAIGAGIDAWRIATLVGRAEFIVAARHAIGLREECEECVG